MECASMGDCQASGSLFMSAGDAAHSQGGGQMSP